MPPPRSSQSRSRPSLVIAGSTTRGARNTPKVRAPTALPANTDHHRLPARQDPGLPLRVVDIVGLLVDRHAHIVALAVIPPNYTTAAPAPPLPMNPGLSGLLEQVNATGTSPPSADTSDAAVESTNGFLRALDQAAPRDAEIYLVKHHKGTTGNIDAMRSSAPEDARHLETIAESTEAWADEVSRCLGHRHARLCHGRAGALAVALRDWRRTVGHDDRAFVWIGDRESAEEAAGRRLANS